MRAGLIISAMLLAAGCGEFTDGGANDPVDPDDPAARIEAEGGSAGTQGFRAANANVEGVCAKLEVEDALRAKADMESFGKIGDWEIFGTRALACSEPYLQARVECELGDGGKAVLDADGAILGFENTSGALVSALISPEGVECVSRAAEQAAGEEPAIQVE